MAEVFGDVTDIVVESSDISALNHLIAGWFSGSAGILVGHPFDTVKVQVQTTETKASFSTTFANVRHFGISHGFYRGVSFPLISQGALCALFFAGYGYTLEKLRREYPDVPDTARAFTAGCVGALLQLLPCCPVEIVKCNLQARLSPNSERYFHGPYDCLKAIYRQRGFKGCFRGLGIHGVRDTIGYGIYTASDVYLTSTLVAGAHSLSPAAFLAGGLAGCVSWFSVTPIDVVKSRIQSNDLRFTRPGDFFRFVVSIGQKEGWRAYFKGGLMSVVRAFPVNTVTLPLYHWTENHLKGYL